MGDEIVPVILDCVAMLGLGAIDKDHASAILFPKMTKPRVIQIYRIVGLVSSAVALFFAVKLNLGSHP